MRIEHLIITRFSIRGLEFANRNIPDPLDPDNLALRFRLFEMVCLPSILAQTSQDFGWVLLVDKDLLPEFREKLAKLVGDKERVYLHNYDASENVENLDWLGSFWTGTPDYVLTTLLDDDDAIPNDFVRALHSHLSKVEESGKLPPFKIIGNKQIVQWDLVTSRKAPLGWKSPWHRGNYTASVGFSLFCKYPEDKFSVLKVGHVQAENYFNWSVPPANDRVIACREALGRAAESSNEDIYAWSKEDTFYDIAQDVGPVLMTNHFQNVQMWRLYEKKTEREKVVGPETFPGITIDWGRARTYSGYFGQRKLLIDALPKVFAQCKRYVGRIVRKWKRAVKRFGKAILKSSRP